MIPGPNPFLESAVVSFSLRDMLASGGVVHLDIKFIGDGIHKPLEFLITVYLGHSEPRLVVDSKGDVHGFVEFLGRSIGDGHH
jgi:hypothetical protein